MITGNLSKPHKFATNQNYTHLHLQDFRLSTMQGLYYHYVGLIAAYYACDPQELNEEQLRAYYVHVRCQKGWTPKSCR